MPRYSFRHNSRRDQGARNLLSFERLEERLALAGDFDVALTGASPHVLVAPGATPLSYEVSVAARETTPVGLGPQVSVSYSGAGVDVASIPEEFLPVEAGKSYALSFWARSGDEFGQRYNPANQQSFGFASYDANRTLIGTYQYAALDRQAVGADWNWSDYPAIVGANSSVPFRTGTVFIKPVIVANQHGAPDNYVQVNAAIRETSAAAPFGDLNREVIDLTTAPRAWEVEANQAPSATLIKIDPAAQYRLNSRQYNLVETATKVFGFNSFDIDQKQIHPLHVTRFAGAADTMLVAPLNPGATSFLVADATGWSTAAWQAPQSRSLAWYGYRDSTGKVYGNYTYTRNVAYDFDNGVWAAGGIVFDSAAGAYRVTLTKPWAGPALPAGAAIRNADSGEVVSLPFSPQSLGTNGNATDYVATIGGGVWQNGARSENLFRPGATYIQAYAVASLLTTIEPLGYAESKSSLVTTADQRLTLNLDVLDQALRALPAQAGDYNRDGVVDTADYTLWRDQQGGAVTPLAGADGTGDSRVTSADYVVWRDNFGRTAAASIVGDANRDGEVHAADYTVLRDRNASASELNAWRNNFGVQVPLTITAASAKFGTATITTTPSGLPAVRYESPAWFVGTEVITYSVRNEHSGVVTQRTAHVQVTGDNIAQDAAVVAALASQGANATNKTPVVKTDIEYTIGPSDTLIANGWRALKITEGVTDSDPVLAVKLLAGPRNGALNLKSDGTFVYTVDPGFVGNDTFEAAIFDGLSTTRRSAVIEVLASEEKLLVSRMSQIGLAMTNYDNSKPSLPGPFFGAGPTAGRLLSWRVAILPFLGMQSLYNALTIGPAPAGPAEEWMPDIFRSPGDTENDSATRFQIISSANNLHYFRTIQGTIYAPSIRAVSDGNSSTLFVVHVGAEKAMAWTEHEGYLYDPANPLAALGSISAPYFYSVTADFRVSRIPATITASDFTALLTLGRRELFDLPTYRRQFLQELFGADVVRTTDSVSSSTRLRELSLAALNYETSLNELPRDISLSTAPTTRLLSWRIQLLPYLGLSNLYNQFHRNEAWDSPHNLTLLDQMPDIFRSPGDSATSNTTRIQAIIGPGAVFTNNADGSPRRIRRSQVADRSDDTIFFAEIGPDRAVPWTKPEDASFIMNPWAAVGSFNDGGNTVILLDGSVKTVPADFSPALFSAMVSRAGQEYIPAIEGNDRERFRIASIENEVISAKNNLSQLILGANNSASSQTGYLANISNANGSPLLSWRVALLPHLGEQGLYEQFHRDEPWNSPHNLALIDKMPAAFRSLGAAFGGGVTSFMRFVGADAPPLNVRYADITDGASKTIFAVDAGPDVAVPWTKPDDLPFISEDPASVLGELGSILLAAYFNVQVRILPSTISAAALSSAITHRSADAIAAAIPLSIPLSIPTSAPRTSISEEEEAELSPLLAAFAALTEDDLLMLARREDGEEEPYYLSVEERELAEAPADITLPELAIW